MYRSPPGSSIHGIPQARILDWLLFLTPGGIPDPAIKPASLMSLGLTDRLVTTSSVGPHKILHVDIYISLTHNC